MAEYAYVRVSTKEQNIERQLEALKPYNITADHVYCDWQTGMDFNRPAYKKLIKRLHKGDLLIIKSIDRLGRNYHEILAQWQKITKDIGADILVLDMTLLDIRNKAENLTGALIADLVLQILAYVAESEREFIHRRQAEGIAVAKAKGRKMGRKPKPLPLNFEKMCKECAMGQISTREAAKTLGMSHTTFFRRYKENGKNCVSDTRNNDTRKVDIVLA